MSQYLSHIILNNHFLITANRTIFWEEEKILIVCDLHIGKSGHFRKNGIGIPQNIFKEDMQRLFAEIQNYQPRQLIIVGDLTHSQLNKELNLFLKWRKDIEDLAIHLVVGNHDILNKIWYKNADIQLHENCFCIGSFVFTHDISTCKKMKSKYYFSGHIHPGIKIKGTGKQTIQLPCFYFGKNDAVLPAFGKFTGTHTIKPQITDVIFAIAENAVIRMQ